MGTRFLTAMPLTLSPWIRVNLIATVLRDVSFPPDVGFVR
jgi:hypothetical protein